MEKCVRRLKPKLSSGFDIIPSFIVKGCSDALVPVLTYLFILSLENCIFPEKWKSAVVVPIFKSGNSSDVANYRPVSLLSSFSKLFESVVEMHLPSHFK